MGTLFAAISNSPVLSSVLEASLEQKYEALCSALTSLITGFVLLAFIIVWLIYTVQTLEKNQDVIRIVLNKHIDGDPTYTIAIK